MHLERIVGQVVIALLATDAHLATKYVNEFETVRAKRVCYNGKINKRSKRTTVVVSLGRPNYREREFIKKCKKAGEPFPVKKIQLKFPSTRSNHGQRKIKRHRA